jgi:HSP20 family molecular chaperone IbpA
MSHTYFDLIWKNWTRPMLETSGYKITETNDGFLILANTVGVSKDDLKLELKGSMLSLSGKTSIIDNFVNSVNYQWNIVDLRHRIKSVDYLCKDGLTYIYLVLKDNEVNAININYRN